MSPKTTSKNQAPTTNIAIIALAAVLLVALLGWLYNANFTPHRDSMPPRPGAQEKIDWISAKARETHGDYSKLSPEDQQTLEDKTEHHGAMALEMAWRGLSQAANAH